MGNFIVRRTKTYNFAVVDPHPIPASIDPERSEPLTDLATLYERHAAELRRYVRHTFGSGPPEPDDVVQATFAHFAALAHPSKIESPRAFLYRSARNFVIDQRRRALVHARAAQRGELKDFSDRTDELTAARVLDGKDRLRVLSDVIRAMPERLRDALILHRIEELSYVEVARRLGMSETSAKRLVAQAILECTRALRENGCEG